VSSPDSEVIRLTNQHRFARNLKFAKLMEALRRDAKRMGFGTSSYAGSSLGSARNSRAGSTSGSICGDLRTPSEANSETPSYAAGRPTSLKSGGFVGVGRKHYVPSDTQSLMGEEDLYSSRGIGIRREATERTPAPFAILSDLSVSQRRDPPPRTPAPYESASQPLAPAKETPSTVTPFASGGNYEEGYRRQARPPAQGPSPDFWKSKGQYEEIRRGQIGVPVVGDEKSDVASQCGARSEASVGVVSVADSQREVFAARNRGHGNILTWGNDSRDLTPTKKREGRHQATNAEGMPRSYATSGVFPPSPQS